MRKILILLGCVAVFGAGCKITRQGHQFVISSETEATVIEGVQQNADLRSNIVPNLSVIPEAGIPMGTFVLPKP